MTEAEYIPPYTEPRMQPRGILQTILMLLLSGCLFGCAAKAKPELARPPVWTTPPRTLFFAVLGNAPEKDRAMAVKATAYTIEYLTKIGFTLVDENADLSIWISLEENPSNVNLGHATVIPEARACTIVLNNSKIKQFSDWATQLAMNTVALHETGHCLGLVFNETESAQRGEGEYLNHCRHPTCVMSKWGVTDPASQIGGWLLNGLDGKPEFCGGCRHAITPLDK